MRTKYKTVSIPKPLADDILKHMKEIGYWPSLGSFIREAAIEKMYADQKKRRLAKEEAGG